jgi:steroid delta-isomerase-like uncharacterized protein
MHAYAVAEQYFDAWNRADPEAIAAIFTEDGTYRDPAVPQGLDRTATAQYATALFAAFPDLAFAVESHTAGEDGLVMATWRMKGTNRGPFQGLPPSGREIDLLGVDAITVIDDRVHSVVGYFDTKVIPEQLGLQVIVQPRVLGPFAFGVATFVAADDAEPGAVSLTVLEARSPQEIEEVRDRSRDVVKGMMATPGFISWLGVAVGKRLYTITAWRSPEDVASLRENPAHVEAMERFFAADFARGGQTGVWAPHRLNGMWVRCDSCDQMTPASDITTCACGAELAVPRYW